MAARSTRNKVKWQADKALRNAEHILEHLKFIDDMAKDRSNFIKGSLPVLVGATEMLRNALAKFRQGL